MKLIEFKTAEARSIYENYLTRSKTVLRILSEKDQRECLLEINSHIYESLHADEDHDEAESLKTVLNRLGEPESFLRDVVISKKTNEAIRTFNPKSLFHALLLNTRNGFIYIILFVLLLFLLTFPILAIIKIFIPEKVGLFIAGNQFHFGFVRNTAGYTEYLGWWFIPIVLISFCGLYTLIILLLKTIRKNKS